MLSAGGTIAAGPFLVSTPVGLSAACGAANLFLGPGERQSLKGADPRPLDCPLAFALSMKNVLMTVIRAQTFCHVCKAVVDIASAVSSSPSVPAMHLCNYLQGSCSQKGLDSILWEEPEGGGRRDGMEELLEDRERGGKRREVAKQEWEGGEGVVRVERGGRREEGREGREGRRPGREERRIMAEVGHLITECSQPFASMQD